MKTQEELMTDLKNEGFDAAIAIATEAEITAGAACGQLAIIDEDKE